MIDDIDQTQAPLLDHLLELRTRLLRAIFALAVAFGVCLYFADRILGILIMPLARAFPAGTGRLIYTKLYGAFFVEIKVALFAACLVSFPIIANQLWAFIAPGLYAREKKAFLPFLIATPVLFAMGASLAYFVVMPTAFRWFIGFQGMHGGLQQFARPGAREDIFRLQILAAGEGCVELANLLIMIAARGLQHVDHGLNRRFGRA